MYRLENLIKTKTFKIPSNEMEGKMAFQTTGGNYVLYEKGIGNFKARLGIPQNSIIVSVMPSQTLGYLEYATYDENDDSMFTGFLIYPTIQNRTASVLVKYI
jgi:hypothetical protein|nr:MAG TPA: hypothetical protein [Caudoviricetes sp.]